MLLAKLTVGLAAAHHLLTVPIERIVYDRLGRDQFVVVLESKMPETFGDRVEPRSLWLIPQHVVGIRAIDDLGCEQARIADGRNLIGISMQDQGRDIDLREIFREVRAGAVEVVLLYLPKLDRPLR